MAQRAYFPMPNFDYPPNQLVLLGQIIASPKLPSERLAAPLEPLPPIQQSSKTKYEIAGSHDVSWKCGIWTQVLASVLGAGADVTAKWAAANSNLLQFERLQTCFFEPDNEYIARCISTQPKVADFIKKHPRNSLYMITGLKIAHGASHARAHQRSYGGGATVGLDATMFTGVPVQGGPKIAGEKAKAESVSFKGSSDFVYAYRLRRIIVTWGKVRNRTYMRGATVLHHGEEGEQEEEEEEKGGEAEEAQGEAEMGEPEMDSVYLDEEDYGLDGRLPFSFDKGLKEFVDEADEEACRLIIPIN